MEAKSPPPADDQRALIAAVVSHLAKELQPTLQGYNALASDRGSPSATVADPSQRTAPSPAQTKDNLPLMREGTCVAPERNRAPQLQPVTLREERSQVPPPREVPATAPQPSQVDRTVTEVLKDLISRPSLPTDVTAAANRESKPDARTSPDAVRNTPPAPRDSLPEERSSVAESKTPLPPPGITLPDGSNPVAPPEIKPIIPGPTTQTADLQKSFESPVERVLKDFVQSNPPPTPQTQPQTTTREQETAFRDSQRDIIQTIQNQVTSSTRTQLPVSDTLQQILTPTTVSETRGSILQKLTQISEHLAPSTERPTTPHVQQSIQSIQGRDTFQRIDPVDRHAPREVAPMQGDRTFPSRPENKMMKNPPVIDLLNRLTQSVTPLEGLRRIDRALESVCETIVATTLTGVLGTHKVSVVLSAALLELIGAFTKERDSQELSPEQHAEHRHLIDLLSLARETTMVEDPFVLVGDISGRAIHTSTGLGVSGVLVDGGSLGTCTTDSTGHFSFTNVPLGSGFILTAKSEGYTFFPSEIVGTASENSHFCFIATPTTAA